MVQTLLTLLSSTVGVFVLAGLLAAAYTAGIAAGKAAARIEDQEEEAEIYIPHTHGEEK